MKPENLAKPKLLDQVRAILRTKHTSRRTEQAYVNWIKRFILFHNKRHPTEMGAREIQEFLNHLAVRQNVTASTQNQALCSLLFLYREVLHLDLDRVEDLIWAKKSKRLPVVLTQEEMNRVFQHLQGVYCLVGMLLYGAGLRLLECLRLRVKDLIEKS